jgi:hypothetical protein
MLRSGSMVYVRFRSQASSLFPASESMKITASVRHCRVHRLLGTPQTLAGVNHQFGQLLLTSLSLAQIGNGMGNRLGAIDIPAQIRMARLIASYDSEALCVNPRFPRLAGVYT